jgi:hypothetical protein
VGERHHSTIPLNKDRSNSQQFSGSMLTNLRPNEFASRNEQDATMHRRLYGHDYKPPSNILRNLLVGIAAVIILFSFVWTTYDPQTFRVLSGVRPDAKNMQRAVEQQRIDAMQQRDLRDKSARR